VSRHTQLYQWSHTLARQLPVLSKTQAFVLALYSFGMILAHGCGLSAIALALAPLLGQSDNTLRQRLREFYKPQDKKAGKRRRQLDVCACFAPLLAWVLSSWPCRRLALALDVTNLGDRFHVLCISVLYRGCAIPVAWKILAGNTPEAWHPHWVELLGRLRAALGDGWQVLVLTDRGLESPRLFTAITEQGWHPLMRVKAGGTFRPDGWHKFYAFGRFAARLGVRYAGVGTAYKTSATPLHGTLLAHWGAGHDEPWLLLTDLAPAAADPCWYAFRAWIEQGFKVIKSAGWQWQRTRMSDAARAERLWLAVAVATLWLLEVGGVAEGSGTVETVPALPQGDNPGRRRPRLHRVFRRGLAVLLAALIASKRLPRGCFLPEPWPEDYHEATTITEEDFCFDKTYP
jgi:DDE family transposase